MTTAQVTKAQLTGAQVRAARAIVNITVRELAAVAGVHRNTITNIETGRYAGDADTLAALRNALESSGVQFIDENGGGAGVRLRKAVSSHGEVIE